MKKNRYIIGCLLLFAGGAYVWKIKNSGLAHLMLADDSPKAYQVRTDSGHAVLFEVGREKVTEADIEWEYRNIVDDMADAKMNAPIAMSKLARDELTPLKKRIASNLIERKVLFSFIQRDTSFDLSDPARYAACLAEWQAIWERTKNQEKDPFDRMRLKTRLCEQSLLEQYISERLFRGIVITDKEVEAYFKEHKSQFRQFESVTIRHILFVDESTAKRWRGALTVQNFAEMAKSHSITPEGKTGGKLGPYLKGMLPAVFDVAFNMKVGEISDVLRSNYGYHVILLEEKMPKRDLDLVRSAPEIRKILEKQKKDMAYDQWLEQALASIKVLAPKSTM